MSVELTRRQKTEFGIVYPTLTLAGVSVFLCLAVNLLTPTSADTYKEQTLNGLLVFTEAIILVAAVLNCWVFWSDPRDRMQCFLRGLCIPIFAYAVILAAAIHAYRQIHV